MYVFRAPGSSQSFYVHLFSTLYDYECEYRTASVRYSARYNSSLLFQSHCYTGTIIIVIFDLPKMKAQIESVRENDLTLEYGSNELRNNKRVVIDAKTQHGWNLFYASNNLKKDEQFVTAAVT